MKLHKDKVYPLDKCYAIAQIQYHGSPHIVVASEKVNKCILFTLEGDYVTDIWEEPGGTMSIVPIPGVDECFLATQKMYSPNDSEQAKIVLVSARQSGVWDVETIAEIPFTHRFDILQTKEINYLVVSTMKSEHTYRDDWSTPGKFLVAPFETLEQLMNPAFEIVLDGMYHNHGYLHREDSEGGYSVISSDNGVFEIHPPMKRNGDWGITQLSDHATSDIAFVDFDGDGKEEMIAILPFHGDTIRVYKDRGGEFLCPVWELDEKRPFSHSIYAGIIHNSPVAIIGHRKGPSRDLMLFSHSNEKYNMEVLDLDCGSTNILYYANSKGPALVSTNREINEIAFYSIRA